MELEFYYCPVLSVFIKLVWYYYLKIDCEVKMNTGISREISKIIQISLTKIS